MHEPGSRANQIGISTITVFRIAHPVPSRTVIQNILHLLNLSCRSLIINWLSAALRPGTYWLVRIDFRLILTNQRLQFCIKSTNSHFSS
jgi:hypothetical protein